MVKFQYIYIEIEPRVDSSKSQVLAFQNKITDNDSVISDLDIYESNLSNNSNTCDNMDQELLQELIEHKRTNIELTNRGIY